MKARWSNRAMKDREEISEFIGNDNPRAANELDSLFVNSADRLRAYPDLGRPGKLKGTRELVIRRSYLLVYDVSGTTVRILRVLHTGLQWPPGHR
jgi:toxin ParE1/3/4